MECKLILNIFVILAQHANRQLIGDVHQLQKAYNNRHPLSNVRSVEQYQHHLVLSSQNFIRYRLWRAQVIVIHGRQRCTLYYCDNCHLVVS